MGRMGILSASGTCRPFGAGADETVVGEGAAVVVLRPLAEALRRGNRVYGVIKGTGASVGAGTVGFTAPNPEAQAVAIRRSLREARVDPRTISFIEAHGTGTSLGDPIEVRGLTLAYLDKDLWSPQVNGTQRCKLGALKPNIGHLEAGAGVVGLVKVLLQLERGMLVPTLGYAGPNPQIPFDQTPFEVQTTLEPWNRPVLEVDGAPVTVPRRAGISSFGVGGIQRACPSRGGTGTVPMPAVPERPAELVVLSARSATALDAQARQLEEHLKRHPDLGLRDVAFSLATTRSAMDHRMAIAVARARRCWTCCLRRRRDRPLRGACGAGRIPTASWPSCLPGRARRWPAWAACCTARGRRSARRSTAPSPFSTASSNNRCALIWAEPSSAEAARLDETGYTQPALFALEYALAALWRSWGVEPELVAGHSIGELVAACVARVFSLEDAVRLVAARGRLMQALPLGGAMVSIAASPTAVAAAVAPHATQVSIAAINGPEQVVISGAEGPVQAIAAAFVARGVRTRPLRVSHAFHSPLIEPMLEKFLRVAESVTYQPPTVALVSNLSGTLCGSEVTTPGYWVRHVREAVRFANGVKALHEAGATTFVEVGPRPALLSQVSACLPDAAPTLIAALRAGPDEPLSALLALGAYWANARHVSWPGVFPEGGRRVALPTYPFQRNGIGSRHRLWLQPGPERSRTIRSSGLVCRRPHVARCSRRFGDSKTTPGCGTTV